MINKRFSKRDPKTARGLSVMGSKTGTLNLSERKLSAIVNELVASFFCRVFELRGGYLYLLVDHHRYANYKDAKRMKIGATKNRKDGFYYITEPI